MAAGTGTSRPYPCLFLLVSKACSPTREGRESPRNNWPFCLLGKHLSRRLFRQVRHDVRRQPLHPFGTGRFARFEDVVRPVQYLWVVERQHDRGYTPLPERVVVARRWRWKDEPHVVAYYWVESLGQLLWSHPGFQCLSSSCPVEVEASVDILQPALASEFRYKSPRAGKMKLFSIGQ